MADASPSLTTSVPSPTAVGLGTSRSRIGERVIVGVLGACAALSVVVTIGIVIALLVPTIDFLGDYRLVDFVTGPTWAPLVASPEFGVIPLVVGTLLATAVALVVAIPIGLGAAIYLSEYASGRTRKILKPALELLAGIPTVVYGFIALNAIGPVVKDHWPFGSPGQQSALAAGLAMGLMIVPLVASLSEDAMSAVPEGLRQAAYGLGADRREVATGVVVPAALSGIVASFVLAISRAVGETTIVLIAAGGTPTLTFDPAERIQTMTSFIASAAQGDLAKGTTGYNTIFAVGSLLFILTFALNALSIRFVRRFREVYE